MTVKTKKVKAVKPLRVKRQVLRDDQYMGPPGLEAKKPKRSKKVNYVA